MATRAHLFPRFETKRSAWKALENHYRKIRGLHLRDLFADDPTRGERMAAEGAGLYVDYSKNRITDQTLKLLVQLATRCRRSPIGFATEIGQDTLASASATSLTSASEVLISGRLWRTKH